MARVTKPGGVVAASVWDYPGGFSIVRMFADTAAVVREYIRANPDRIVWGSNWPLQGVPDITVILNVLASAAGSSDLLRHVLVDNPEALYGFDPAQALPSMAEFLERIHPDDREMCMEAMANGMRDGTDAEVEYRVLVPARPPLPMPRAPRMLITFATVAS